MDIDRREHDEIVSYVVTDVGTDFVLTCLKSETKPLVFSLYVWQLLHGEDPEIVFCGAVEQITGCAVAGVEWHAGNGHGDVQVTYQDNLSTTPCKHFGDATGEHLLTKER